MLFYIFHALPEGFAACILLSGNVRKTFGTGMFGDWRAKDETEKQKTKRLAKRAAKEAKKGIALKQGDVDEKEENLVVIQGRV